MQSNVEGISNGILEFENVDVGVSHIPVHYTSFIVYPGLEAVYIF